MQKLVYFAHGWHLGLRTQPLIGEPILAWPFGPVVEEVYQEFKMFRDTPITRFAFLHDPSAETTAPFVPDDNRFKIDVISRVWELYRDSTASQLSTLTHKAGSPWAKVTDNGRLQSRERIIPNALIAEYFASKAKRPMV